VENKVNGWADKKGQSYLSVDSAVVIRVWIEERADQVKKGWNGFGR
jgi:hypothetical protein